MQITQALNDFFTRSWCFVCKLNHFPLFREPEGTHFKEGKTTNLLLIYWQNSLYLSHAHNTCNYTLEIYTDTEANFDYSKKTFTEFNFTYFQKMKKESPPSINVSAQLM